MTALHWLGVTDLTAAFAKGKTDPAEALSAFLTRIERLNPQLNAFLDLRANAARLEAEASAARYRKGAPLSAIDGAPFGVKANIAVAGLPLHAGIAAYKEDIAAEDARVVAALKAQGAIPVGILNMHEGALGATTDNPHFGRCANPWNASLTPGGSSGGSAAAVAARLVPFALGTDTMGSVRIPSAYCGIAGFKPGKGRIAEAGVLALSPTLDHVGLHALTASDLAAIAACLFEIGVLCAPQEVTVGFWRGAADVDPDVVAAFDSAVRLLGGDALPRADVSGFDFGALRRKGLLVSEIEGHRIHARRVSENREGFSPEFAAMLDWGAAQEATRGPAAYAALEAAGAQFAAVVETAGVLVLPTAPQGPFRFDAPVPASQADFTCLANFAGLPAVAVPASREGAPPASIQFIAPKGEDGRALAAAMAFESVRGAPPIPSL